VDKRIAVRQHAKADQEDNPDAKFIADEANKVEKETQAQLTSHDRDDENPTPGGNHPGSADMPGNSERTKIADSEEHDGNKDRAPGERGTELTVQKDPMPKTPPAAQPVEGPKTAYVPKSGGDGRTAQTASPQPTPMPMAPGAAGEKSPDVNQAADGTWVFNPVRPNAGQGIAKEQGPGAAPKDPNTNVPPTPVNTRPIAARASQPHGGISLAFEIGITPDTLRIMKMPAAKNGTPNAAMQPPPSRICRRSGAS